MRDYQASFVGGEITPSLHSNVSLQRYHQSLALCKNWFVHVHGGISTRPGLEYLAPANSSGKTRLIRFEFNELQTYILAFSDQRLRFLTQGGYVLQEALDIADIRNFFPTTTIEIEFTQSHGRSQGDLIYLTDTGLDFLDNNYHLITNIMNATALVIGTFGDVSAYTSGGYGAPVYELETSYLEEDLFDLKTTQSADVLTITSTKYPVTNLRRLSPAGDVWELIEIDFFARIDSPENLTGVEGGTGDAGTSKTYRYVVTAVNDTADESLQSEIFEIETNNNALSETRYIELSWDKVASARYYNVYKENSTYSGVFGFIGESSIDNALLSDERQIVGLEYTAYLGIGGIASPAWLVTLQNPHGYSNGDVRYLTDTGIQSLDNRLQAVQIDASQQDPNQYHVLDFQIPVGTWTGGGSDWLQTPTLFRDYNFGPDMSQTPPIRKNPFRLEYPECSAYFQQRQWYANVPSRPQTVFSSRTANYGNLDTSRPIRADDAIEFTIASDKVNAIQHIIATDRLLLATSDGFWVIAADRDSVLTPTNINPQRQGGRGASNLEPIQIDDAVLYLQSGESRVRTLGYTFQTDKYSGNDLSILSEHLFLGHKIVDWTFAEEPYSLVWAVRDDGVLLSMAYLPEHNIWGWSQHDTAGRVESIASIPEGTEDGVYVTVAREIEGQTRRYIERLHTRRFEDIAEAFCVDSGLTYRGPTHDIQGATTNNPVVITAPDHGLVTDDVIWIRDVKGMVELNNMRYRVTVLDANQYSLQDAEGRDIDGTGFTPYESDGKGHFCVNELINLSHLEGELVVGLADGNTLEPIRVVDGRIDIPQYATLIHVGLPFVAEIETLDVDFASAQTVQSRKKGISRVALRVLDTRGLSVGPDADKQYEIKERTALDNYNRIAAITGEQRVEIATDWSDGGRMVIQQQQPLPATILATIPEVVVSV